MRIDTSKWSGEGEFTQLLIDRMQQLEGVAFLLVEDAPASRSDADYNFISNEIFVGFASDVQRETVWRFGILPSAKTTQRKRMTVPGLEQALATLEDIGAPDYADEGMVQYLRSQRVIPPYQTRGYKIVELVRIYEAGAPRRS